MVSLSFFSQAKCFNFMQIVTFFFTASDMCDFLVLAHPLRYAKQYLKVPKGSLDKPFIENIINFTL
jgi:hypothetical protein